MRHRSAGRQRAPVPRVDDFVLGVEVAEVGDGAAEGSEAEAKEDGEDFERGAAGGLGGRGCGRGVGHCGEFSGGLCEEMRGELRDVPSDHTKICNIRLGIILL